jgi:hypothetical protein
MQNLGQYSPQINIKSLFLAERRLAAPIYRGATFS